MMLASLFQFSFLCVIALANLCLGFAIASRLGWGPDLGALFEFGQATATEHLATRDRAPRTSDEQQPAAEERATGFDASDSGEPIAAAEPATAMTEAV